MAQNRSTLPIDLQYCSFYYIYIFWYNYIGNRPILGVNYFEQRPYIRLKHTYKSERVGKKTPKIMGWQCLASAMVSAVARIKSRMWGNSWSGHKIDSRLANLGNHFAGHITNITIKLWDTIMPLLHRQSVTLGASKVPESYFLYSTVHLLYQGVETKGIFMVPSSHVYQSNESLQVGIFNHCK